MPTIHTAQFSINAQFHSVKPSSTTSYFSSGTFDKFFICIKAAYTTIICHNIVGMDGCLKSGRMRI